MHRWEAVLIVRISRQHTAFSYYNAQANAWQADAGPYEIRVGRSSILADVATSFYLETSYRWIGNGEPFRLA